MKNNDKSILDKKYKELETLEKTFVGYPCDAEFDYSSLYRFLRFPINNVGDPFEKSTYRLQTKEFEREVLKFFSRLLHIKDYWGYITNGGTEGNLYGLYAARENFLNATVFFSEDAHYSIRKNVHILRMKCCIVRSLENGEMDYSDFENKLHGQKTAIIVANIGTTMKGAIDDVSKIAGILEKHKVKYYIHADAALYGMFLPFCSDLKFDFRSKIDSIAISGHKFIGSPIPCGIVLARKNGIRCLRDHIQYINAHDTTLSGSRDAFTPLLLWYRIKTIGLKGFKRQARYCIMLSDFLVSELRRIGWQGVRQSYLTVYFKKPSKKLIERWELATNKNISHVICLPHETKKQLSRFVGELAKEKMD
jgi:histidine decarboxylase